MVALLGMDDARRKRSRNFLLMAIASFIIIGTIKLSVTKQSLVAIYTNHSPFAAFSYGATTTGRAKKIKQNPNATIGPKFEMSRANKAAVIIETRFRSNLIPLILHFKTVLGPSWPVLIYTSAESASRFAASASLNRYLHAGSIEIRILPPDVLFTNSDSVNAFMTQKWLWESLTPAEHILVFQSDSMICGNAARSVDDYFDFDLVGAPIATGLGQGYNGGLSLRKRSTIMRILNANNWQEAQLELSKESQVENGASQVEKNVNRFEDQWYYQRMIELQAQEKADGVQLDDEGAINLPSMEIARTFSVETIDYPHPLGVHQVHRWLKKEQHTVSLDEWCPEYKLCSTEHVDDTSAGKSA